MSDSTHAAVCPDCQSTIKLPLSPELYMRITCPECGTPLEIINDGPWEVDYADGLGPNDEMVMDELEQDYEDYEEEEFFDDEEDR
jgi:hydrogenase maturation factor HypF (carbamoyltransferase family)